MSVDRGLLGLALVALVWPLGAWLVVVLRGSARPAWRTFARAAVTALAVALAAVALALVLFYGNGTTGAMASLGPQILAGTTLVGALLSALVALVLRLGGGRGGARER